MSRNRQTGEAIKVWKGLLAAYPDDEELCEDIIELHIEEGLFPQAATLLQSLIARTKDPYAKVTRRLRLGDIHYRAGQRQKAIAVYASTLSESGQDTWLEREILCANRANLPRRGRSGRSEKAVRCADRHLPEARRFAAAALPAVGRLGRA